MRAVILAVGSELLGTDRLDTNSLRLTRALRSYGVDLVGKAVVGDRLDELTGWLSGWLTRVDVMLISGGLGPTHDDMTREAVAAALGRQVRDDAEIAADIERKFASMGLDMPPVNLRQAQVIDGAEVLANPRGTAPGLFLEHGGCALFLFPGVPRELEFMVEQYLGPWLEGRSEGRLVESRTVRVACRSESAVEERLQPLYEAFDAAAITVLASPGDIEIRLSANGTLEERRRALEAMVTAARTALGSAAYSEERDATLERVVGRRLAELGLTVATAESCTAGLLAERLTRVAGSSDYFLGGMVTYSNASKVELLGIEQTMLSRGGAVSEAVARAMAESVRQRLMTDYGVGITGIAGPDGGSDDKPVGTVHIAVAGPDGTVHRPLRLPGDRSRVRQLSSQWALDLLRRALPGGA